MRYFLCFALSLLIAACNLASATQSETEILTTPTLAITATALATQQVPATQTPIPTSAPSNKGANNPACSVRTDWQTYTVVAGDTLSQIAQRAGSDLNSLMTANCLTNADALNVGQVLRVPSSLQLPPTSKPSSGTLPRVGEVAGMPELSSCWASNPGTNPVVYNAVDGTATAILINRAIVGAATTTGWVQVNYVGGADIKDGIGWMRVADVNLLGSCTEKTGVPLESFIPLVGNPSGIPDGVCAVVVHDSSSTIPVYRDSNGFQFAKMTGWGRWKSTFGNFYEVQYDDGGIGWVSASLADRANC